MKETYVIIPSLNPDKKLNETVNELLKVGFENIILVNDGSDEAHLSYFPKSSNNITVLTHEQNKGKGAALKTAFKYIFENCKNAERIVTVDGDGQHRSEDVLSCVNMIKTKNTAVLGCRDFSGKDVPKRSRFGNRTTSLIFKLLCGMSISDTQTGLRAFSVDLLPVLMAVNGDRFEYETNMLIDFKKNKVRIEEVKIQTVYLEENKSSHFRPIVDSFRVYKFIIAFALSSVISCILDISAFYIFLRTLGVVFGGYIALVATVLARLISSLTNYLINKNKVFNGDKKDKTTIIRYYTLAIPQMLVSAGLVTLVSHIFGTDSFGSTAIKAIVDTIIFFISFRIQQNWVFKRRKQG